MAKGRAENGGNGELDSFGQRHVSGQVGGEGGQDGDPGGDVGFVSSEHTVFITDGLAGREDSGPLRYG